MAEVNGNDSPFELMLTLRDSFCSTCCRSCHRLQRQRKLSNRID